MIPESVGEIVRCINESLALKYHYALEQISDCTGHVYNKIHMVGGGIQSKQLCQFTANASGCFVTAGPVEATVLGNVALQLMASGQIKDITEARKIIGQSPDIVKYEPKEKEAWEEAYKRYKEIVLK